MKMTHWAVACALFAASSASAVQWMYADDVDPMTGKKESTATLMSVTMPAFSFPYNGTNIVTLMVRQHPTYGEGVILHMTKGQLLCRSYEPCQVKVRFDDKPPQVYNGYPPADHSSNLAFLRPTGKFIAEASKAKKILVQIDVFKEGAPVLEFRAPQPLVWQRKK